MNRSLLAQLLCAAPGLLAAAAPEPRPDLLRFENGDQLHGAFQGVKDGSVAIWKRDDMAEPGEFKTDKIQKVILRGARPLASTGSLGHVALVNGDRLPGSLVEMDEETVTVNTTFAGVVRIPRKLVATVAPSPHGPAVRYYGPYSEDGWQMINLAYPDGIPAPDPSAAKPEDEPKDDDAKKPGENDKENANDAEESDADEADAADPNKIPRWMFSGAAWYWNQKKGATALVRRDGMNDRSALRFDLAWRNRLNVCVAFHADFSKPAEDKDEEDKDKNAEEKLRAKIELMNRMGMGDSSTFAKLFGNCYVLQINSGYAMMYRCTLDKDGEAKVDRLPMNTASLRLSEMGAASFELRCDRRKGAIHLHVNGDRAIDWSEPGLDEAPDGYAGKGAGFGFFSQMENSMARVSDVVVADWNGNPDSARSMQSDEQDIVLLANGTDRFSGRITGFREGKLTLNGRFGDFAFPLAEVGEVRFARKNLSEPEELAAEALSVRLDPLGRVSGKPLSGDARKLRLSTSYAGDIEVNLDNAVMLDFDPSTSYLDDWDEPF